jgi:hypothetical protein
VLKHDRATSEMIYPCGGQSCDEEAHYGGLWLEDFRQNMRYTTHLEDCKQHNENTMNYEVDDGIIVD